MQNYSDYYSEGYELGIRYLTDYFSVFSSLKSSINNLITKDKIFAPIFASTMIVLVYFKIFKGLTSHHPLLKQLSTAQYCCKQTESVTGLEKATNRNVIKVFYDPN